MSQRARVLILASVGGVTGAASALATEAILKMAAFILLILGSTLAIGTAIASGRSDPGETVRRSCRLQLVAPRLKEGREPLLLHYATPGLSGPDRARVWNTSRSGRR